MANKKFDIDIPLVTELPEHLDSNLKAGCVLSLLADGADTYVAATDGTRLTSLPPHAGDYNAREYEAHVRTLKRSLDTNKVVFLGVRLSKIDAGQRSAHGESFVRFVAGKGAWWLRSDVVVSTYKQSNSFYFHFRNVSRRMSRRRGRRHSEVITAKVRSAG